MKVVVTTFNQEKALVGLFSLISKTSCTFVPGSTGHRTMATQADKYLHEGGSWGGHTWDCCTTSLQHCYTTTTVSSTQHSNRGSFVPLGSWLHLKPTTTARGDNSRAAPGAGPKLNTVFRTERVSVWTVCRIFLYTQIQWFSRLHWIFVFNILFVWPINIIEFSLVLQKGPSEGS